MVVNLVIEMNLTSSTNSTIVTTLTNLTDLIQTEINGARHRDRLGHLVSKMNIPAQHDSMSWVLDVRKVRTAARRMIDKTTTLNLSIL